MTTLREAAQMALEALGKWSRGQDVDAVKLNDLIFTLEAALAQEKQPTCKDEIMQMANKSAGQHWMDEAHIQRFAALVAAAEREACAYRAGVALLGADRGLANRVDQSIRARGQA